MPLLKEQIERLDRLNLAPDEKYLWLCERHLKKYKRPKASYDKPKK